MLTDAQLRRRVGRKVICTSWRCKALSQATVLGILRPEFTLDTTHAVRHEPGGVVCLLKRGGKRRTHRPMLIPPGVRVRCPHCKRVLDLGEIEAENFA